MKFIIDYREISLTKRELDLLRHLVTMELCNLRELANSENVLDRDTWDVVKGIQRQIDHVCKDYNN